MSKFFEGLAKIADVAKRVSTVARKVEDGASRVQDAATKAETRLGAGLCPSCGEQAVEGLVLCPTHLALAAKVAKKLASEG